MKSHKYPMARAIFFMSALIGTGSVMADSGTYQGEALINNKHVTVAGKDFVIRSTTDCRDHTGTKISCSTLAQVGYATNTRVTVSDGAATRIQVLTVGR